jgi:hypothetical protein
MSDQHDPLDPGEEDDQEIDYDDDIAFDVIGDVGEEWGEDSFAPEF